MNKRTAQETLTRHTERETLAASMSKVLGRNVASGRPSMTMVPNRVAGKREAAAKAATTPRNVTAQDRQLEQLNHQALHAAQKVLSESGIGGVTLSAGEVEVDDSLVGPSINLIRTASIKLNATVPYGDGMRVAQKNFSVNLTFDQGKYSVNSFECQDRAFPVNKGSMSKIIAMEAPKPRVADKKKVKSQKDPSGWNITSREIRGQGADPTTIEFITLAGPNGESITLEEFQGIYQIETQGVSEPPKDSYHASFGGNEGPELDTWLTSVGAPNLDTIYSVLHQEGSDDESYASEMNSLMGDATP